jgi:hypothetical protein
MTPRELATVLSRVLAIHLLVLAASQIIHIVGGLITAAWAFTAVEMFTVHVIVGGIGQALPPLLLGALGIALWRKAEWIASKVVEGTPDESRFTCGSLDAVSLQQALLLVVGVFLIADAVPSLIRQLSAYFSITALGRGIDRGMGLPPEYNEAESLAPIHDMMRYWFRAFAREWHWGGVAGSVLQLAIGLWLALGGRSVLGLLDRVRRIGLQPPASAQPDDNQP